MQWPSTGKWSVICLPHWFNQLYFYIINDLSIGITWLIAAGRGGVGPISTIGIMSLQMGGGRYWFEPVLNTHPTLSPYSHPNLFPLFDSNQNTILWWKKDCGKAFAFPPRPANQPIQVTPTLLSTTKITDHNMRRFVITLRLPFPRFLPEII
jgi:hypothetical protein